MPHLTSSIRVLVCLLAVALMAPAASSAVEDGLLSAMTKELKRSYVKLRHAEKDPLYYLAYEVHDTQGWSISAQLGAVRSDDEFRSRQLTVDARVGTAHLDDTHQMKGEGRGGDWPSERWMALTIEEDEAAIRADIFWHTDKIYKDALKRYTKVQTNKAVTADEDDKSDDFSREKSSSFREKLGPVQLDREAWRDRMRRLSIEFKKHPFIIDSEVSLEVRTINRYIVNTEGTSIVTGNRYLSLRYSLQGRTTDGMDIDRSLGYDADDAAGLPSEATVRANMEQSVKELAALLKAPLVEPYTGPAIFRSKAAGVYFHEILGHRLEGHRQKLEDEGQTFAKKLGQPVTALFLSVFDDASRDRYKGRFLNGSYRFDDEGIPSRKVTLIENGILKGFLMSRSPNRSFASSNGHGRRSPGNGLVARMGNTFVQASATVPYERLHAMLIEEIQRQKKPYGLIFEDVGGGYTGTGRLGPQSFKVIPKLVWRVYPDGRPDEAVRGVDIVGTPLTSFSKILAAADDYDIFNGYCGAESGWVPVSAVAPSLLLSEVEVEKNFSTGKKQPLLPPPHHDKGGKR